jgi:hypothetical protein
MNNKRKVLVNIERLKLYLSQNLPELMENSQVEEALPKKSSPSETLFIPTDLPPENISSEQIPKTINKSVFPSIPVLHLHLSNNTEAGLLASSLQLLHPNFLKTMEESAQEAKQQNEQHRKLIKI